MTRYLVLEGRPRQFRVCIIFLLRRPEVIVARFSVQVARKPPLEPLQEACDGIRQGRVRSPDKLTHSEIRIEMNDDAIALQCNVM